MQIPSEEPNLHCCCQFSPPTMLALLLLLSVIVLYIMFYYLNEWREFKVWKVPPGPTSLPLLGNILQLTPSSIHHCLTRMSKMYGKVFSIKLGRERVVILNDAKVIKSTYNGPHVTWRPKIFSLDFFLEKGFMTCREQHDFQLHTKMMRQTFKVITRTSLCEKLHEEALCLIEQFVQYKGVSFDPKDDLNLASLNILHNIAFGKRYQKDDEELRLIFDYTEKIGRSITPVHPVNLLPWLENIPNPWISSMAEAKASRDALLLRFFEEHMQTFREGEVRDLVDCLIKLAKEAELKGDNDALRILTPYHIIINIWTIFFAGSDTILNALLWIFLYLAAYPEVQARVQRELDDVIGRDRMPTLGDEERLPYLCAVIYETIRFSSMSLFGVPHATKCDTFIGGYFVPAGTQVLANFYAVNRSPENWENPDQFCPERFVDERGNLMNLASFPYFMPFSTGRRACLGKDIGKSEILVLTACLMQRLTIKLPPGRAPSLEPEIHFDLVPKQFQVIVEERP